MRVSYPGYGRGGITRGCWKADYETDAIEAMIQEDDQMNAVKTEEVEEELI